MVKKKTIYHRSFAWYVDSIGTFLEEGVMRDIIPDGPYEILSVGLTVNSKLNVGIVTYFAMAKNVDAQEPVISLGQLVKKSGVILHWEPNMVTAGGTSTMDSAFYPFPEPITFDENDKLNFALRCSGAEITTYVIELAYRRL